MQMRAVGTSTIANTVASSGNKPTQLECED
jgi:hypothetical protein